ncbi:MAG: RNA polymerase sigma factor [Planctomycetota bacterium]|jgi:DNA-directed RNA polymerase specialized sigma24 family protein
MGYVLYKQQIVNAGNQHHERITSSDCKGLPRRFSNKQVISAWRGLPDKDRLIVFLVDLRQLGIERTAEIMNRPVAKVIKEVELARALVKKKLWSNCQEAC